jgi:hypothetical protein
MSSRRTTTHDRSQDDANYHVRQHARIETSFLHIAFVFRANHASTDAALNVNGTISN